MRLAVVLQLHGNQAPGALQENWILEEVTTDGTGAGSEVVAGQIGEMGVSDPGSSDRC